jgi:hypothetical protein
MEKEQARIRRIDLENKYLDDPIDWPAKKESDKKGTEKKDDKKDVDKNYAEVFFRPPRGIDRKPQQQQRGMLYEFRRAKDIPGPIQEIWIGTGVEQKDFAKDVGKLFPPAVSAATTNHVEVRPPGRNESLAFDVTSYDDANSTYLRCIYKKGDEQVALIFHLDKVGKLPIFSKDEKSDSELVTKIELSLESLGLSQDAARLRSAFLKYHPKSRSK